MRTASEYRAMTPEQLDSVCKFDRILIHEHPEIVYDFSPCDLGDVTMVVASYRVVKLIRQTIETFKRFYPDMPIVVVDDTGQFGPDPATDYIKSLPGTYGNVRAIIHATNQTHGPSLHEGIVAAQTRLVFTMDSDMVVRKAGLIEAMKRRVDLGDLLVTGPMSDDGYVATAVTLWNRERYLRTPGIVKHSLPTIAMTAWFYEHPDEFRVENCPGLVWEDHVEHIGAGTRCMFNSNRGWWDPSSPGAQDIWVGSQLYRDRQDHNRPELN